MRNFDNLSGPKAGLRGCLLLLLSLACTVALGQTPVEKYGALKVVGNKIVDKNNQAASLAGNSLFWSNAGWGGEKYYNASVVNWLKTNWKSGVVRVAMGVDEPGGYLENPAREKQKVKTVVDACISAGLYVIIDWHSHKAEAHQAEAIAFFQEMATTYGTRPNVIYEIYNEPLQVSWSGVVKPYAVAVTRAIRAIDPDNLIVVGTPTWSQDVDVAAGDPITGFANIAYTLHFYAATHKDALRAKAATALSKNIALFVTEYGTCEASGNGFVDQASTQQWMDFMKQNKISHCNWSINDKAESASVLTPGASTTGNWTDANLTQSGRLVKGYILNWNATTTTPTPTPTPTPATGTKVEAESYHTMSGVQTQATTDTGGGLNVGYLDPGDWIAYSINVPTAGTYTIQYRVASLSGGGRISLEQNSGATVRGAIAVPSTGGWQNWTTISHTVTLNAGQQDIAIGVPSGGYNINWWSFTKATTTTAAAQSAATQPLLPARGAFSPLTLYPNPARDHLTVALSQSGEPTRLSVYNALGQKVLTQEVVASASAVDLPIANLQPGMYSVQVAAGGHLATLRFLKE